MGNAGSISSTVAAGCEAGGATVHSLPTCEEACELAARFALLACFQDGTVHSLPAILEPELEALPPTVWVMVEVALISTMASGNLWVFCGAGFVCRRREQ